VIGIERVTRAYPGTTYLVALDNVSLTVERGEFVCLLEGQAALFSNKSEDRFRLVALYNDMPMLIILPVGASQHLRRQLFLRLAEWLVRGFKSEEGLSTRLIQVDFSKAA
jgi:hypothetical protein